MCKKTGIKKYGPIPLPTRHLKITVRKAISGQGTSTFAKYEMRIHKRLFEIIADEKDGGVYIFRLKRDDKRIEHLKEVCDD